MASSTIRSFEDDEADANSTLNTDSLYADVSRSLQYVAPEVIKMRRAPVLLQMLANQECVFAPAHFPVAWCVGAMVEDVLQIAHFFVSALYSALSCALRWEPQQCDECLRSRGMFTFLHTYFQPDVVLHRAAWA